MDITKQPATGAAETVLLFHQWIHPLHVNNCLLQLSYQIWPQKTPEGSPDCWANWYSPPHSPRTVLIQIEQKGWQNPSDPSHPAHSLFELLQSSEHQNDQTQEQFLPSGNPSHEHLTLNVEHTTLLYITYSSHILIFHFKFSHVRPHTWPQKWPVLFIVFLLFCTLPFCIFVYYSLIFSVLSCCCHFVALWSLCHYNKFLVCVNIPG